MNEQGAETDNSGLSGGGVRAARLDGAPARIVEVAVGVVFDVQGRVLLGSRPAGKPYSGYWEFPGGKIEPGESVAAALARELDEETGISIGTPLPWVTIEHRYPHAHVRLHFMRVHEWTGTPEGREGQQLRWSSVADALPAPLLPAALPCLRWLSWPDRMGISSAAASGQSVFLDRLDAAFADGLRLIQVREPAMDRDQVGALVREVVARAKPFAARVLVSSRHGFGLAEQAGGLHLTEQDLLACDRRPDLPSVGASVHTRASIDRAADLGLDYALLGTVLPSASHPHGPVLGWRGFAELALDAALPVYAIGGLSRADLDAASHAGAHGIALLGKLFD
ncbi:Nudix family hydrolase [soil metagenome]